MRTVWYIERYDAKGKIIQPWEMIAKGSEALDRIERHFQEHPKGWGRVSPPYGADKADLDRLGRLNVQRF
ncbi:MAG TPA: hypothetical protein VL574_08950 [Stellaceae bacterium]|jgi:hypothetical protein|nr:hypothetical protein [Stellaceae bacterium]